MLHVSNAALMRTLRTRAKRHFMAQNVQILPPFSLSKTLNIAHMTARACQIASQVREPRLQW
jgi:hypothetical protein